MGRIRSVHPGQWDDEDFVSLSFPARLLVIAIRNEADDNGIFEWKPLVIKMRLFPADSVDVNELLAELEQHRFVKQFSHGGRHYGAIRNFRRFQRPKKPNSLYPMPDEFRTYIGLDGDGSELADTEDGASSEPDEVKPSQVRKSSRRGRREEGEKEVRVEIPSSIHPEIPVNCEPVSSAAPDDEDWMANLSAVDRCMAAIWRATGEPDDRIRTWMVSTGGPNRGKVLTWLKSVPPDKLPGIIMAILERCESPDGDLRDGDGRPIANLWAYLNRSVPTEWERIRDDERREAARDGLPSGGDSEAQWDGRVRLFFTTDAGRKTWEAMRQKWGPMPTEDGCRAPKSIISVHRGAA